MPHAAGDILAAWLQDMSDACRAKDGWKLIGSVCSKTAVFIAGIVTAYSIVQNLSAARRAEAIARADKIEQSLRSNVIWERFWGLENLESYPAEYPALLLQNRQQSTPFEFSKRALVDYIDRFKLRDGRQAQVLSGRDQLELGTDVDRARERNKMLKVLSEFGKAGWYQSEYQLPPDQTLDPVETIDLHWPLIHRPNNARLNVDPLNLLEERDLTGVMLYRSNLACISLKNSLLNSTRLQGVSFYYADLSGANFSKASVEYIDFVGTTVRNTVFEGTQLSGTSTEEKANTHVQLIIDRMTAEDRLKCASQRRVQSNFTASIFKTAQVSNSSFNGSVLTGANFGQASVQDTTFQNVEADGISFADAIVVRSSFENSQLGAADFSRARLSEVKFAGTSLTNASFNGAQFISVGTSETLLTAANLERANFVRAQFDRDITCELIARGGVLVSDVDAWSLSGRPLPNWQDYASEQDKKRGANCPNVTAIPGDG